MEKNEKKNLFANISKYHHRTMGLTTHFILALSISLLSTISNDNIQLYELLLFGLLNDFNHAKRTLSICPKFMNHKCTWS